MPYYIDGNEKSANKTTRMALFAGLAVIFSIVESFFLPPIPLVGVKWGFANIITLVMVYLFSFEETMIVVVLRTLIVGLLLGTFLGPGFAMSITGATIAAVVMFGAHRLMKGFSVIGISVCGAVSHNLGQIMAAMVLMEQWMVLTYLPVLLLASIPTGVISGLLAKQMIQVLLKVKR